MDKLTQWTIELTITAPTHCAYAKVDEYCDRMMVHFDNVFVDKKNYKFHIYNSSNRRFLEIWLRDVLRYLDAAQLSAVYNNDINYIQIKAICN